MSIKKALKLLSKFAEIPVYPKCQVCGDADPYADPNDPYCHRHFDSNKKSKEISDDDKKLNILKVKQEDADYLINTILKKRRTDNTGYLGEILAGNYVIVLEAEDYKAGDFGDKSNYFNLGLYNKQGKLINPNEIDELNNKSWTNKSWIKYFTRRSASAVKNLADKMPKKELGLMISELMSI